MSLGEKVSRLFAPYRLQIEEYIEDSLKDFGPKNRLRDACEYALKTGGKRFRPSIVLIVAKALNPQKNVIHAAMAVEYFHTASLIADDLPCMDDEEKRRDFPTTHKAFDEAIALLATYALISAGYEKIRLNATPHVLSLAIEVATSTTGILGATGGQYLDLYFEEATEENVMEIIEKKTGTLFELSFSLGWLFGGGDPLLLPEVKKAARHFGIAFQIVDDFQDLKSDAECGRINYPHVVGIEKGLTRLQEELEAFKIEIKKLQLYSPELFELVDLLENAQTSTSSSLSS